MQAFPQFEETNPDGTPNPLAFTLHSVRDAFAINYGTGASAPRFCQPVRSRTDGEMH